MQPVFGIWNYRNEVVHGKWKESTALVGWLNHCSWEARNDESDLMMTPFNKSWRPSSQRWLQINTNVAVKDGNVVVAVMFRDHLAQVKFVRSCMVEAS